jgi:hypothetical protein
MSCFVSPVAPTRLAGVQFCDSCTEVTTAAERARRHHERTVLHAEALLSPR